MPLLGSKLTSLLFIILAVTSVASLFEDPQSVTVFERMEDFQLAILDSDFLVSFLVCSETTENCKIMESLYKEFAENMKDFVKATALICDSTPEKQKFPICSPENIDNLPYLAYFEPPATKLNPYTKQISKPIEHVYQGDADPKSLANFARQHMPAFRESISSKAQLDKFLSVESIPNKVILFTNKPQTSPLYKALASEYRYRLLFAEIQDSSQDLIAEFGITKYPTLLVMKRTESGEYEREFYEYDLAIEKLRRFLKTFALGQKAEVETPTKETKEEAKSEKAQPKDEIKFTHLTAQNFETEVNKHERVVLVHLFNEEKFPILDQVVEKFTRFFEYFDLDCTNEDNLKYARDVLNVKTFPALVALPIGKEKKISSRIVFSKTRTVQEITQGVSEFVEDKIIPISGQEMQGIVSNSLAKRMPAFIYLYDTDEVSLSFRAVTRLSKYQDKIMFTKLRNPAPEVRKHFELDKLPALVSVLLDSPIEEEIDPQKVRLVKYSGRFIYEDLKKYMDMFLPEEELLQQMASTKEAQEVKSQEDFKKYCPPESKACLVALLNGNTEDEAVKAKFDEKINALNLVLKRYPHLPFVWIDAICHSELLIALNIQSEDVPTAIVYSPVYKEYSQLVGTFDTGSLTVFLEKALKRRLPVNTVKEGIVLQDKDCKEVHEFIKKQEASYRTSTDEDEIMKELLAEMRRKEEAAGASDKKKKKKKKRYDDDL